jgi:hypothetical protein
MPKRKRPEEKPEDQFKRFVEAAKEQGVDEHVDALDAAFREIAKRPVTPKASRPRPSGKRASS